MKKPLSLIEKVAMIWTFPITLVVSAAISIVVVFLYFLLQLLNITGTFGACIYLFDKIKMILIDRRMKKLIKDDEELYKFGSEKQNK
jgi:hypothetical protein